MTIYEIAIAPASQAYLDDRELFNPGHELLGKVPGVLNQWTGIKIEDKKTIYHVVEWESQEHFDNFLTTPGYHDLINIVKTVAEGPAKIIHIPLDQSAHGALDAPVTEFCFSKLKDVAKADEMIALVKSLGEKLTKGEGCFGPAPIGAIKQDSGTLALLIGWDSVERHGNAVANEPGIQAMLSLADLDVFHSEMKKWAPSA